MRFLVFLFLFVVVWLCDLFLQAASVTPRDVAKVLAFNVANNVLVTPASPRPTHDINVA